MVLWLVVCLRGLFVLYVIAVVYCVVRRLVVVFDAFVWLIRLLCSVCLLLLV